MATIESSTDTIIVNSGETVIVDEHAETSTITIDHQK